MKRKPPNNCIKNIGLIGKIGKEKNPEEFIPTEPKKSLPIHKCQQEAIFYKVDD